LNPGTTGNCGLILLLALGPAALVRVAVSARNLYPPDQYIKDHHLGGVMFWELSHDTPYSELLRTLAAAP
jgi:hypothetical protein